MATAEMIAKVKMALRLSSEDFDAEVSDLIDEATEELERQGASDDALISKQAEHYIKTYCRAHFSPDAEQANAYANALTGIADAIRRSSYSNE